MHSNFFINKKIIIGSIIIFIAFSIIILILATQNSNNNLVLINNFDEYVTNISNEDKNIILKKLYSYINMQNSINNINPKPYYKASFRKDSVDITQNTTNDQKVSSINAIVDIEDIQYSYRIKFNWLVTPITNQSAEIDLGSVNLYCLKDSEYIYDNFNCEANPSISEEEDSVFSIDPIINQNCWFSLFKSSSSKSGYGMTITFYPSDDDITNNTIYSSQDSCINKTKQTLKEAGLDFNSIEIITEIQFF